MLLVYCVYLRARVEGLGTSPLRWLCKLQTKSILGIFIFVSFILFFFCYLPTKIKVDGINIIPEFDNPGICEL